MQLLNRSRLRLYFINDEDGAALNFGSVLRCFHNGTVADANYLIILQAGQELIGSCLCI